MRKKKEISAKGFTIIEVMIVLAVAALILIIVFLAVPALKRQSNNTARFNDAETMLGALQECVDGGNSTSYCAVPANLDLQQSALRIFTSTTDPNPNVALCQFQCVGVGIHYGAICIVYAGNCGQTDPTKAQLPPDSVQANYLFGIVCAPNGGGAVATAADPSDFAVTWEYVASDGSAAYRCIQG